MMQFNYKLGIPVNFDLRGDVMDDDDSNNNEQGNSDANFNLLINEIDNKNEEIKNEYIKPKEGEIPEKKERSQSLTVPDV